MENLGVEPALQALFAPVLTSLEAERRLIVNRNYNIIFISMAIILLGALFAFDLEELGILIGTLILGLIVYFVFANKGASGWRDKYKKQVIEAIVKSFFGETGQYEPHSGHSESEFIDTNLFDRSPDRFHSEDLIKGKVDKTLICFSEVHAEYKTTGSKGKTNWHTLFKGFLFTADFNKHFNGRTIIKQKSFWNFLSHGNIELENPAFREEFAVYANDPIEARYILSPALMEKMLQLNKNWGESLGFSFIQSQVKIAIPMHVDFFEISIWSKLDIQGKWLKDWQIIADLVSVVHDLDLNTRIWTKE